MKTYIILRNVVVTFLTVFFFPFVVGGVMLHNS